MKLLRRKEGPSLDARLAALVEAADLGEGRLPEAAVSAALAVAERAGARRGLSLDHTVAALAGATGSGKSSLYNALAGSELAAVGVTRPTTSTAQAAVWDGSGRAGEPAGPLLDWLDVPLRHPAAGDPALSGLVLLDLPDHDSIRLTHRLEVDRLVELVDLLVWVVDPQKYADAALHERYLRRLAGHRDVTLVVLNQVDRLPPSTVGRCLDDLGRLLAEDGLAGVPVLPVSARTGEGMEELRVALGRRVAERRAWSARLSADVAAAADRLAAGEAPRPPVTGAGDAARPMGAVTRFDVAAGAGSGPERRLTRALAEAGGVPLVVEAVAKGHRHRAVAATGWPPTRWVRRLRPDPLGRLRIGTRGTGEITGRTSVPAATAGQRAQVETAVRDVAEAAAAGLPAPWAAAVRQAARAGADDLADAVDRAVARTSTAATRRPRWWRAVGVLQWLVLAVTVAGALWLAALFAMDYLRLPAPPPPTAGPVPWPTALLLGGALAGVLVALLSRLAAWAGGRRRARRTGRALRAAIGEVADEYVLAPVAAERDRYARFTEAVTRARA
ncbi:YfjP family GTPase [Nonomuraea pusilla]|uniref:YfjP family GTPase n=1 Tax=Nonomuraea pusilla TaxID=46177 RepID=UPI003327262D